MLLKILIWYKERWWKILLAMFVIFLILLIYGYILVVRSHSEMRGMYITVPFVPLLFIFKKDMFFNAEYSLIFYFVLGSILLYIYEFIKGKVTARK